MPGRHAMRMWWLVTVASLGCAGVMTAAHGWAEEPSAGPAPTESLLQSSDAGMHLTHASIQFYHAQRLLTSGEQGAGETLFRHIEQELLEAQRLSLDDPDAERRRLVKGQAAFLLGQIHQFVFKDPGKAQQAYEQALAEVADHDGARQALKSLK